MFLKGITIGFSIAAPVGPIGLLCIRRSLSEGILAGLVTGLGAASADAVYGCIAGFGLTAISSFLVQQKLLFGVGGGAFLCFLGCRILLSQPATKPADTNAVGLFPAYASTFLLTLSNPLTILSFAAVFAGFGLGATDPNYSAAVRLVGGVFIGSALWWLVLSGGVGLIRSKIGPLVLRSLNLLSGGIILAFGIGAIVRTFLG